MNQNDEIVCAEALALLRQEARLQPGFSAGGGNPGKVENACLRAYDYVRKAFLAQYDWGFARREAPGASGERPDGALRVVDMLDGGDGAGTTVYTADVEVALWPPVARAAFVAMLARELCIPVCGRQEDLKSLDALFSQRITAARLADLRDGSPKTGIAYEVLSLLGLDGGIKSAEQIDGVFMCLRRMDMITEECAMEILPLHYWRFAARRGDFTGEKPDGCVRVESVETVAGRRVGWTIRGDEIAADADAAKISYTAYVPPVDWPPLAKAALIALVAHKTSIRCGLGADAAKALLSLYADRLMVARAADLNEDCSGSAIVREVKAVLKSEWSAMDANLDESAGALAARIAELVEPCRREVMNAHRWNFARTKLSIRAVPSPAGEWTVPRPAECVRVEAVETPSGELCQWSMRGGFIVSKDPVGSIVYIRDEEDLDEWPPAVRRALVYRLAADASLTCAAKDAAHPSPSAMMELYRQKLSDAALQDAREGNPGRSAWGRGVFSSAFRDGGFPRGARRFRHG